MNLKDETSKKRLGDGTSHCFRLCDLFGMSTRGFSVQELKHIRACLGCRNAYNSFMRLRRNDAREKIKLPPWEDMLPGKKS